MKTELELNTKFGKRKIEVEPGRCEGCPYYVNCYGRDISFLEIQGSESYIKYENEKYYTDIYKLCTYEIRLVRPVSGTFEKNIPEIFPELVIRKITDDINQYCKESCIMGECMGSDCILNKWKKYVKEEKEEIQSTEND